MDKCIILFIVSGALWLIFKLFEELAYKFWGGNEYIHRFFKTLTDITETAAYVIFIVTLIFTVYLYIFR